MTSRELIAEIRKQSDESENAGMLEHSNILAEAARMIEDSLGGPEGFYDDEPRGTDDVAPGLS